MKPVTRRYFRYESFSYGFIKVPIGDTPASNAIDVLEVSTLRAELTDEDCATHEATIRELELRDKHYQELWLAMVEEKQ